MSEAASQSTNAPINVFPQGGDGGGVLDYRWEIGFFENLGSISLPMGHKCVLKIPWTCLKIYTQFHLEL